MVDSARLTITNTSSEQIYTNGYTSYQDGKYYYDNAALTKVDWVHWYPGKSGSTEWTFVFQPDLYDYYLIGTLTASTSSDTGSTFKPTQIEVAYRSVDSKADLLYSVSDTNIYNIDNSYYKGFGFSTKVDFASAGNTGISYIAMIEDKDGSGKQPAALAFEAGILAIDKSSSESAVLSQILNQIIDMESSLDQSLTTQIELQEKNNEISQEQLEVQQEQVETQKSLLERVTDFFDNFFENLINAIIGLFVPSEEEMSELFNELNDFFSDKFGFLYYPFEFLIKVFDVLVSEGGSTALTFPAINIMGYELCPAIEYDIANNELVGDIFGYIRMVTGGTMCFAFVNYLRSKFDKTVKS